MKRKELLAALQASLAAQRDLLSRGKSAPTPEEKTQLKTAFEVESKRYESLNADLEEMDLLDARAKVIDDAKKALVPDTRGKNLNPEGQPGARDNERVEVVDDPIKDLIAKKSFFLDYVRNGGKDLSGQARDSIAAKSRGFSTPDAVALPPTMIYEIFGGKVIPPALDCLRGKVMLTTDVIGGATDSGTGNLVAPNFIPQMLRKPVDIIDLFNLCRVIPAANGRASFPMLDQTQGLFGGVAFTWKSTEGADKGETQPSFVDFEILTNELSGWTEMSIQALSRSAIGLEAFVTELFRDAARREFSRVIIAGTGTNQPEGILASSATPTLVPRLVLGEVSYNDLINLEYAIPMAERAGARFVISDAAEGFVRSQVDGLGRPLFAMDVASGMKTSLGGYPYLAHRYGASGAIAVAAKGAVIFGNFQNYMFAIEDEIAIARSDHAEFKKGRIVFRLMALVGGKPIFDSSFAVLKLETT